MRRFMIPTLILGLTLGGAPLLIGCEDTLEHDKTVEKKSDGTEVTKEKKTTASDGTVTTTEKKDVSKP